MGAAGPIESRGEGATIVISPDDGWRFGRRPRRRATAGTVLVRVLLTASSFSVVVAVAATVRDPSSLLRVGLVRTIWRGIAGWPGLAFLVLALGLVMSAVIVWSSAYDRREELLIVGGVPVLCFHTSTLRRVPRALAVIGAVSLALALGWVPVRGLLPWAAATVAVSLALVPSLSRVFRAAVGDPDGDRVELDERHLRWVEQEGSTAIAWSDIAGIDALATSEGFDGPTRHYLGVRAHPWVPLAAQSRARRRLRSRVRPDLALAIPVAELAAHPSRLYWTCAAFLDPAQRQLRLAGPAQDPPD